MANEKWQPIDTGAGLWFCDYRLGTIRSRSLAVRLKNGSLMIVSPGRKQAEAAAGFFDTNGQPSWLLAPNHYHRAGLREWVECFDIPVACGDGAKKRLTKMGHGPLQDLNDLRPQLSDHTEIWQIPGSKTGELIVVVETERGPIWLICDAFLNIETVLPGLLYKVLFKCMRMGPGLVVTRQFRHIFMSNWRGYRSWLLGKLADRPPIMVIPSHGAILERHDLKQRLTNILP